ncbi:MAG TPA: UBP-type zinc finger domain-containing protein [Patescibacteria group bacterium]|nr:UBP-type zinc finger domain-containing protein [Patescibacteria group bacterium]
MPKKQRKPKFRLQHLLPAIVLLFIVGSVAFYGSTQLKPGHADTAAYYSCNAGDPAPSGSTCTHTTSYAATYNASTPYCSGSDTYYASSDNCAYPATQTATYTCNSGDSGGGSSSTCYHYYQKPVSGCAAGDSPYLYSQCLHTYTGKATYTPSCPRGGSYIPNSGYCSYPAYHTAAYYSCANGDTLNGSTCTHTATYTATYHPATTSVSTGGGSTGGGTTSGSTTSTKTTTSRTTSGTKSSNTPVTISPVQPPSAPSGLSAKVKSSKVVELTWTAGQAAAGVQNYEVDRSVDNSTWATLASPSDTTYTDASTDFSTKYYYRVREIDTAGTGSDYATVTASTGKFSSSSNTIRSDDKLVTVQLPDGAFDRPVNCSVTSSAGGLPTVPTKSLLIGPYDVLCIDENGTNIASYKKPLQVTMDLSGASSGYGGFVVRLFGASDSSNADAKYDAKAHKISFELAASKSFAAYGTKQKSALATVFQILLYLLLLAGAAFGALYLRRYWSGRPADAGYPADLASPPLSASPAATTLPTPESVFETAANRPACTHLNMAQRVQPQTAGCAECLAGHTHWKGLRICLTCGHVGCSDDSDQQHARKHFEQTGHPLIYDYGNPAGDTIGWCYIDQTYI